MSRLPPLFLLSLSLLSLLVSTSGLYMEMEGRLGDSGRLRKIEALEGSAIREFLEDTEMEQTEELEKARLMENLEGMEKDGEKVALQAMEMDSMEGTEKDGEKDTPKAMEMEGMKGLEKDDERQNIHELENTKEEEEAERSGSGSTGEKVDEEDDEEGKTERGKPDLKKPPSSGRPKPPLDIKPLRSLRYPPILNIKQEFRWPVVRRGEGEEVRVEEGAEGKPLDTRPLSLRSPPSESEARRVGECGGSFNQLSGIVTSPEYPYNYPNSIACIYEIKVPSQYSVGLDCNDMSIQPGNQDCENDFLMVLEGQEEEGRRYCGDKALSVFSRSSNVTLVFSSNEGFRYRGFMCRYRALNSDGTGAEGTVVTNTTNEAHPVICSGPGDAGWTGKCGVVGGSERVVGGEVVQEHQYPWMVAMLKMCGRKDEMYCHICGGTVIHTQWVLTGAHCTDSVPVERLAVLLGDHNLYTLTPSQKFLRVDYVYVHPDFNIPTPLSNDIALAHLPQEIALMVPKLCYVSPICMPPKSYLDLLDFLPTDSELSTTSNPTTAAARKEVSEEDNINKLHEELNGRNVSVNGWGIINDDGDPAQKLRGVDVTILPNSECEYFYGHVVNDKMLCTSGAGGHGPCGGDSGSPGQITMKDGRWMQIAVLAFGAAYGCEVGYPSGNALLPLYVEWMEFVTGFDFSDYY